VDGSSNGSRVLSNRGLLLRAHDSQELGDTNGSGQVIGFDIAKSVFQVHGINTEGEMVVGVGSLCSAHTKWAVEEVRKGR
jgi:hypothetical protein